RRECCKNSYREARRLLQFAPCGRQCCKHVVKSNAPNATVRLSGNFGGTPVHPCANGCGAGRRDGLPAECGNDAGQHVTTATRCERSSAASDNHRRFPIGTANDSWRSLEQDGCTTAHCKRHCSFGTLLERLKGFVR